MDVTIRGAGVFGLSIAWACATRGARVRLVDPHGIAAGASGGVVGALAPHVPENWNPKKAFQFESLILAESFWRDVQSAGGRDPGYARSGRVQPLADDKALALARARAISAQELWQGKAQWEVTQSVGDFAPDSPSGWYVHDTLSARLHPRQACEALYAALETHKVTLVAEAAMEGPQIWATGWQGLRDLSDWFGRALGVGVKGQAAVLRHDAGAAPQVFVDGLHVIAHADGTVAVGSTSERDFADPEGTDDQCDDLIRRARDALPVLQEADVVARWAGIRPRAKSRAPVLGDWPERPGHFVANGGFKIGFGMAPKIAEVMADLVLEGVDAVPPAFRLDAML